jgi:hypothetical protein
MSLSFHIILFEVGVEERQIVKVHIESSEIDSVVCSFEKTRKELTLVTGS